MVNNGSGAFVSLVMVSIVFGAGYLFSESSKNATSEAALMQSEVAVATLAPKATQVAVLSREVENLHADTTAAERKAKEAETARDAAEVARAEAESKAINAEAARIDAESKAAGADAARGEAEMRANNAEMARGEAESKAAAEYQERVRLEGQLAAEKAARVGYEEELARAKSDLGVATTAQANAEERLENAYAIYLDQQATIDRLKETMAANAQTPVTGRQFTEVSLAAMLGVAFLGLVTGVVVMRIMTPNGTGNGVKHVVRQDPRYTYVKMTREEARQYGRRRQAA